MNLTGSNSCLLDTSIVIEFFRKKNNIAEALDGFDEICLNAIAIGELYYGAYKSLNPPKHIRELEELLERCQILNCDSKTAIFYGRVKNFLKTQGTPIPENDMWIAATAVQYDLPLYTNDNHFKYLSGELELI